MQCVLCHTPMSYDGEGYVCPICGLKLYTRRRDDSRYFQDEVPTLPEFDSGQDSVPTFHVEEQSYKSS